MPLVIILSISTAICAIGWVRAPRRNRKPSTLPVAKPTAAPAMAKQWQLKTGDKAIDTRFGPIIMRIMDDRAAYSGKKGFLILPEGVQVTEILNAMLDDIVAKYSLSGEQCTGIPNSHRIWVSYHTRNEQFDAVHSAVAAIIEGRVPALT